MNNAALPADRNYKMLALTEIRVLAAFLGHLVASDLDTAIWMAR